MGELDFVCDLDRERADELFGGYSNLSPRLRDVLTSGIAVARTRGQNEYDTAHVIAATMATEPELCDILAEAGITAQKVVDQFDNHRLTQFLQPQLTPALNRSLRGATTNLLTPEHWLVVQLEAAAVAIDDFKAGRKTESENRGAEVLAELLIDANAPETTRTKVERAFGRVSRHPGALAAAELHCNRLIHEASKVVDRIEAAGAGLT